MVLLEQVGFQERFPKYPQYSVYHAAIQNRCFALLWDSERSRLGWERGMLQSCSLSQDRKILLCRSRNSLYSANPEFESRADSQLKDSFPAAQTMHQFLIVWLYLFLRNRSFVIPQFLGNILRDVLGRFCSSFPFLLTNWSFLSLNLISPLMFLIQLQSLRLKFSIGFREGNISISLFPLLVPCQLQLQIIVSELRILLKQASQLSARGRHANLSCQTRFAHFQDLDLFSLLNTSPQHW